MGRHRFKDWLAEYAYLVTIASVMAVIAGCAVFTQQLREREKAGIQAAAQAPEIAQTIAPSPSFQVTPLPTIAPAAIRPAALISRAPAYPVSGEIIRGYDARTPAYWAQLGCWQAHTGVDIAGKAGEAVSACEDGTVISVAWDELWGWRICVDQGNGLEVLYAGLQACVVQPGAQVRRGQTLGTLMEHIPCEGELETHLHLQIQKNGNTADPQITLFQR